MDNRAIEGCGEADSFTSANISTISSSLFHPEGFLKEEVQPNGRSKSVDPSEGVNGERLQTSAGSVPTESYEAVSAIAVASARAAVVASAVSSMTALVAAVTYPPSRQQYNARFSSESILQQVVSNEARGGWRRTLPSSPSRPGVSAEEFPSPFEGFAPWPKEGRNDQEDGSDSEWDKPSTLAPACALSEGASASSTNYTVCGIYKCISSDPMLDLTSYRVLGRSKDRIERDVVLVPLGRFYEDTTTTIVHGCLSLGTRLSYITFIIHGTPTYTAARVPEETPSTLGFVLKLV